MVLLRLPQPLNGGGVSPRLLRHVAIDIIMANIRLSCVCPVAVKKV